MVVVNETCKQTAMKYLFAVLLVCSFNAIAKQPSNCYVVSVSPAEQYVYTSSTLYYPVHTACYLGVGDVGFFTNWYSLDELNDAANSGEFNSHWDYNDPMPPTPQLRSGILFP